MKPDLFAAPSGASFSFRITTLPVVDIVKPTVVDIRHCAGASPLYIGRQMPGHDLSQWANHHKLTTDTPAVRATAINAYVLDILGADMRLQLHTLRGQTLGCWCAPKLCHGNALAELVMQQKTHGVPCPNCGQSLRGYLNLWHNGTAPPDLYEAACCLNCNARGYFWRELPHAQPDGTLALLACKW